MPSYTLGTLMSQATAMVGSRLELTPSQVSFYVNTAQLDIAKTSRNARLECTTTLTTVASVNTVALPTNFLAPINVATVSSADSYGRRDLLQTTVEAIDTASEGTALNRPNRYAIFGTQLVLYPTPATGEYLTLRYQKYPSDMTLLSDQPSLTTDVQPAILYKAAELLFAVTLDAQREAVARARYLAYMQSTPTLAQQRSGS